MLTTLDTNKRQTAPLAPCGEISTRLKQNRFYRYLRYFSAFFLLCSWNNILMYVNFIHMSCMSGSQSDSESLRFVSGAQCQANMPVVLQQVLKKLIWDILLKKKTRSKNVGTFSKISYTKKVFCLFLLDLNVWLQNEIFAGLQGCFSFHLLREERFLHSP